MRPVLVSIDRLPSEGSVVALEYTQAEVGGLLAESESGEVRAAGPLTGEVTVMPSGRDVFVLGKLRGRFSYACVRCLDSFERDLAADFHVVYAKDVETGTGEVELHRQDLDIETLDSPTLDLTRVVEEQLVLSLDPHPVCSEGCLGLCPACGENRNRGECRCSGRPADPRFAALATLRAKLEGPGTKG